MLRLLISLTRASVMRSRESIFSCIRTSDIFNGCSARRRLSLDATKCSQLMPMSSTVSPSSSSVRLAVFASLTKFWNSASGTCRSATVRIGLVPPRSSCARTYARKVKFSISVKCFIRTSRGVSPGGSESGKSEICAAPVPGSTNLKTLDSFNAFRLSKNRHYYLQERTLVYITHRGSAQFVPLTLAHCTDLTDALGIILQPDFLLRAYGQPLPSIRSLAPSQWKEQN